MSAELDQLTAYGNELLVACQEQLATRRVTRFGAVNASKRTSAAMRVVVTEIPGGYRLQLLAPQSILTLIYGRKPGTFPNLTDIKLWIADKNIVPHPDRNGKSISTDSLAFLIGRAIKNKGNIVFQQGPPSNLFADILSADNINAAIKTRIIPLLVEQVRTQVHEALAA